MQMFDQVMMEVAALSIVMVKWETRVHKGQKRDEQGG